jgi:hypothetical protein
MADPAYDLSKMDVRPRHDGMAFNTVGSDNADKEYIYARKRGSNNTSGYTAFTENAATSNGAYISYKNPYYVAPTTPADTGGGGGGGGKKKSSGGGGGGGGSSGGGSTPQITEPTFEFMNETKKALAPVPDSALETRAKAFLDKSFEVSEQWLKGELSDEVTRSVSQASSEAANLLGIGQGQKARMLTARDLGLKSDELQLRGMSSGTAVAKQVDDMKRADEAYRLNVRKVIAEARELDLSQWETRNRLALEADSNSIQRMQALAQISIAKENAKLGWANLNFEMNKWEAEHTESDDE